MMVFTFHSILHFFMNSFVLITSVQYVKVGCKEMRGDVGGLARQKNYGHFLANNRYIW